MYKAYWTQSTIKIKLDWVNPYIALAHSRHWWPVSQALPLRRPYGSHSDEQLKYARTGAPRTERLSILAH